MSIVRRAQRRGFLGWPSGTMVPSNGDIPSNSSSVTADPGIDGSMRLSSVWGCVRLISDIVSTLPIDVVTTDAAGNKAPVVPTPTIVANPSARVLPSNWRYQLMTSLLLRGNSYGWIASRDRLGWPQQIELIHPDLITNVINPETGELSFYANGQKLDRDNVWHIPAFMLPGWPIGLSPIAYASTAIATGRAAEQFGSDFFTGGGHPTTILSTDQRISKLQGDDARNAYVKATTGRAPAVFGSGWKVERVQIAPNESQFLETIQASVSTIARFFGVPAELIGGGHSGENITYANREQRAQDLLTFCINGWLVRLEEAFTAITPRTQSVRFNTAGLLRSDLMTRFKASAIGIDGGWLTPNDVLRDEGRPTFTGGDEHLWPPRVKATGGINSTPAGEDATATGTTGGTQ